MQQNSSTRWIQHTTVCRCCCMQAIHWECVLRIAMYREYRSRRRSQHCSHPRYLASIPFNVHTHIYAYNRNRCRPIMARSPTVQATLSLTPIFLRWFWHEVWLCENHYWDFNTLFMGCCHWLCCLLCSLLERAVFLQLFVLLLPFVIFRLSV